MSIIQSMTVLLGAGIAAATVEPEAFALVPIFWTVWLLYAQQVDRQTLKWEIYADWLEDECNALVPLKPYRYRSRLARTRGGDQDVVLQAFPHLFAFAILLLTWGIAAVLIWQEASTWWLIPFNSWMLLTTSIIAWAGVRRRDSADRFASAVRRQSDPRPTSTPTHADEEAQHAQ